MSTLWNPTKQDVAAYRQGTNKVKIRRLLNENIIKLGHCHYCDDIMYEHKSGNKFMTMGGSEHKCKKSLNNLTD